MQLPWRSFARVDSNREYLASLSYLPLRHWCTLLRFLRYTNQIQRQLRGTPGLIGYSLEAKPLRRWFWTLSAWESEAALQAFVVRMPHAAAMRGLAGHMDVTAFIRWQVRGSDLPLTWAGAHERERQYRGG